MEAIDVIRHVRKCCLTKDEITFSEASDTVDLEALAKKITSRMLPFQTLEWFLHKERTLEEPTYLYEGCAVSKQALHDAEAKLGWETAACFEARANHMDWLSKLLFFLGKGDAGKWAAERRGLAGGCANSLYAASDAHLNGDSAAETKARNAYIKKRDKLFEGIAPHLDCQNRRFDGTCDKN